MLSLFYSIGISKSFILLLGFFLSITLRLIFIDDRPLHHDESIHAQLAYYYFSNPNKSYYQYDPAYHGPTLYILLRYWYLFSDYLMDYSPRLPVFLISITVPLIIVSLRGIINDQSVFWISLLLLISPTLNFFSTWVREDILVLSSLMLLIFGLLAKKHYPFFVGLGISLATKANFFIHIPLIVIYFLYYGIITKKIFNFKILSIASLKNMLIPVLVGFLIFVFLSTSEFRNLEGAKDIFSKSLSHWFKMHQVERISGPFGYTVNLIAFYEQPLFFLVLASIIHFFALQLSKFSLSVFFFGLNIFCFICLTKTPFGEAPFVILKQDPTIRYIMDILKLKGGADLIIFYTILVSGFFITTNYLKTNFNLAFFSYMFFSHLFAYSFVGEKVPWLVIYPIAFGYIYVVQYWIIHRESLFTYIIISLIIILISKLFLNIFDSIKFDINQKNLSLFTFYFLHFLSSLITSLVIWNFKNVKFSISDFNLALILITVFALLNLRILGSPNSRELTLLSQVHTTKEFLNLIRSFDATNSIRKIKVGYRGDAAWPLAWYSKKREWLIYSPESIDGLDCIIDNLNSNLKELGFEESQINLRGWAIFDINQRKFSDFVNGVFLSDQVLNIGFHTIKLGCKNL